MTEEQIERRVAHLFDCLDRQFMNTSMNQAEYDRRAAEIDEWAERQYYRMERAA